MINSKYLNHNLKSQLSIVEVAFVLLLFSFVAVYFSFDFDLNEQKNYQVNLDSSLNSIYYSESFRNKIMSEDLSVEAFTNDYGDLESLLENMYVNYEFIISDDVNSKKIFTCSDSSMKYYSEKIISISDSGNIYNFRKIRIGVCY